MFIQHCSRFVLCKRTRNRLLGFTYFHDNFLKTAAGQTCWKENLEDGAEGHLEAFATPAVEAFALLCLENNEQDWLGEAKVLRGAECWQYVPYN
jgi:hypothetical protein